MDVRAVLRARPERDESVDLSNWLAGEDGRAITNVYTFVDRSDAQVNQDLGDALQDYLDPEDDGTVLLMWYLSGNKVENINKLAVELEEWAAGAQHALAARAATRVAQALKAYTKF
jgi:hypothetical protein